MALLFLYGTTTPMFFDLTNTIFTTCVYHKIILLELYIYIIICHFFAQTKHLWKETNSLEHFTLTLFEGNIDMILYPYYEQLEEYKKSMWDSCY